MIEWDFYLAIKKSKPISPAVHDPAASRPSVNNAENRFFISVNFTENRLLHWRTFTGLPSDKNRIVLKLSARVSARPNRPLSTSFDSSDRFISSRRSSVRTWQRQTFGRSSEVTCWPSSPAFSMLQTVQLIFRFDFIEVDWTVQTNLKCAPVNFEARKIQQSLE